MWFLYIKINYNQSKLDQMSIKEILDDMDIPFDFIAVYSETSIETENRFDLKPFLGVNIFIPNPREDFLTLFKKHLNSRLLGQLINPWVYYWEFKPYFNSYQESQCQTLLQNVMLLKNNQIDSILQKNRKEIYYHLAHLPKNPYRSYNYMISRLENYYDLN